MFDLAIANLISPVILSFVLGFAAALARSDLTIPEAIGRALALYLMFAIGFKGGVGVSNFGLDGTMIAAIAAGALLSFLIPALAFAILRLTTGLSRVDAAAVAAHYGSISIVTFVAASELVRAAGFFAEGYMVAVAAVMETPAIIAGLLLARRAARKSAEEAGGGEGRGGLVQGELIREVLLNGSIVLLLGAFFIGWATGEDGMTRISPFIEDIFQGVLCIFLLDMGLVAGSQLKSSRGLKAPVIAFGLYMPLISAFFGTVAAFLVGLSVGGAALLITLAASASYIAVPAAMRLALPKANAGLYLTLSLAVTFPFNLIVGIPSYLWIAARIA